MADSAKRNAPILAAGGIVLRGNVRPYFAVVRLRREKAWVLPKGKLEPREHPRDAAKREVLEETGHDVSVHEFLGSMSYLAEGKLKVVQFWLMRATRTPLRELNDDVKAVKWLPLRAAIETLTRPHEKIFLTHVGPIALRSVKRSSRVKSRRSAGRTGKGLGGGPPGGPVGHVIAMDYENTRPNVVKALGNWIDRVNQSAVRKAS
jgi:8-oxo-dGTP diphosphatase